MSDTPQTDSETFEPLKAIERENADARRFLDWLRLNCRVVFYPPSPEYPVEHTMAAKKDQWDELHQRAGF